MDQIIYYERYVVIQTVDGSLNEEGNGIEVNDFITEEEYLNVLENLEYQINIYLILTKINLLKIRVRVTY